MDTMDTTDTMGTFDTFGPFDNYDIFDTCTCSFSSLYELFVNL